MWYQLGIQHRSQTPPLARPVGHVPSDLHFTHMPAPIGESDSAKAHRRVRFDQDPLPIQPWYGSRVMANPTPNIASQVTPLARPANRVHSGYFLVGKLQSDHGTFASGAPEGWRWASGWPPARRGPRNRCELPSSSEIRPRAMPVEESATFTARRRVGHEQCPSGNQRPSMPVEESATISARWGIGFDHRPLGNWLRSPPVEESATITARCGIDFDHRPLGSPPRTMPVRDRPRTMPVRDRPRTMPVRDRPRSAPVGNQPRTMPVRDQPRSAPVGDQPRSAPVTESATSSARQ